MKKQKATAAVTIPANCTVGLTAQQYGLRSHNLKKIREDGEILICELLRPIQFKIGEEFYADELPKSMASLVETPGEKKPAEKGGSGEGSSPTDFAQMKVAELKTFLESHKVEIPKTAKKPELIALAEATVAAIAAAAESSEQEDDEEDVDDEEEDEEDGAD